MKEEEFRKEILDYVNDSYNSFVEYRKIIKTIFKVFHKICIENNINYYYGFGSLLGAIRDGDMIPWDADIDVLIMIEDAKKMIETLKKELPDNMYVVSNYIDEKYYLCETRVCLKEYDPDIVHLDIFYLIGSPDDEKKRIKFDKKIKKYFYSRALRFQHIEKGTTSRDLLVYYAKRIARVFMHIKPNKLFLSQCQHLLTKYNTENSSNLIVWAVGAEIFPKHIFGKPKKEIVNDVECLLPNDPKAFLKIRYGDYNDYLPISDRFEEFYSGLKRFEEMRK